MYRKSRISRRPLGRAMRFYHWRYTDYQRLMGREGLLPYRRWLWSAWAAHRGLREQAKYKATGQAAWCSFCGKADTNWYLGDVWVHGFCGFRIPAAHVWFPEAVEKVEQLTLF